MQRRTVLTFLAGMALATTVPSFAQDKPINIIVPFGPGGSGDISARMLADYITKKTGRVVVVENRPGANGIIGVEAAKGAPADGSVLLLATTSTHLANPNLFSNLPYDPGRDFRLVGSFGPGSTYMLVRPEAPYQTVEDFVKAAKAQPGAMNYGHFNASSRVSGAFFAHASGIELTPIPYKQVGQAMSELIAGQLQVVFVDTAAGDALVASGQLRALAVHSRRRLARYPDLPLLKESIPDFTLGGGFLGIAVPAATPIEKQRELNELINEAVTSEPIKSRLEGFAFAPAKVSLEELEKFGIEERAKWKQYVEIAEIEVH